MPAGAFTLSVETTVTNTVPPALHLQLGYLSAKPFLFGAFVSMCIDVTIVELYLQGRGPGRAVHGVPRGEAAIVWPRLDEDRSRLLPVR